MNYKVVIKRDKQEGILTGKVENENPLVEKINKILTELNEPKLRRFPYKDCQKVIKEFEDKSKFEYYVFTKRFFSSNVFIKRIIKIRTKPGKNYAKFENIYSRYHNFLNEFILDLDIYFSYLNGLAISADQIHRRSFEELKIYRRWLQKSFFERWRQYIPLKKLIVFGKTSYLYQNLKLHNEQREFLIKLISEIIESKK